MKKYLILFSLIASSVFGGTVNLSNDTVYVKLPVTSQEAATKGYADQAVGPATWASNVVVIMNSMTDEWEKVRGYTNSAGTVSNNLIQIVNTGTQTVWTILDLAVTGTPSIVEGDSNYLNRVDSHNLVLGIKTNYSGGTSGGGTVDTNSLRAATIICTNFTGAGIQTALNLLTAGGELYLPAGNYNCSNVTLYIPTNFITIRGSGWSTVLNAFGVPSQTNSLILLNGYSNGVFRDFQILANKSGGTVYEVFEGSSANEDNILFERIWINGSDSDGIKGSSSGQSNWVVRTCRFNDCADYAINPAGEIKVESSYFGSGCGEFIDNGTNSMLTVVDSDFLCGIMAYAVQSTGIDSRFTNNRFFGGGSSHGPLRLYGDRGIATGNIFTTPNYCGIEIVGNYCVVSGNIVFKSGNAGEDIVIAGDYNVVDNNVCYATTGFSHWGIYFDASANNNLVSGNNLSGHDVAGIRETVGAHDNLIVGNNCSGENNNGAVQYILNGSTNAPFMASSGGVMTWYLNNSNYSYTVSTGPTNFYFITVTNNAATTNVPY